MAMNLGVAEARLSLDIDQFMSNAGTAEGAMQRLEGSAGRSAGGFGRFAMGFANFGAAVAPAMAVGLNMAVDLEQAMANLNASIGGIDPSQLEVIEQGMIDIGSASKFSAVEVAAVGDELARAGFGEDEIVATTRAVVDLSQATGADLMTSVDGVVAMTSIWSEANVGAENSIRDVAQATDVLTVAANQSISDVADINAGLRNLGPLAGVVGLGFDESAGSVALFTNYGLKAADVGVSITRGLTDLLDPTAEAATLMEELGIAVFDAEGKFVGLPTLFDQLQTATSGMTEEQKALTLSTLFGAEAIDVMSIAAEQGGDPLRAIMGLMNETGVAAEQSALRMDTLGAQFGELVESVTAFLGSLVSGLLPGLRLFVDFANGMVDALSQIPQPIKTAIGAVLGLAAAVGTAVKAFQAWRAVNLLLGGAGGAPGLLGFGAMLPLLLGLAAVGGGLFAAWKFNLGGVQDRVDELTGGFRRVWDSFSEGEYVLQSVTGAFGTWERLVWQGGEATNTFSRVLFSLAGALKAFQGDNTPAWMVSLALALDDAGVAAETFLGHFERMRQFGTDPLEASLVALRETFPALRDGINAVLPVTRALTDAFAALTSGDWAGTWAAIREAASALVDVGASLADWTLNVAVPTVTGWLVDFAADAWGALQAASGWAWDRRVELGGWILNTATPIVTGWITTAAAGVWDALQTAAGWAWDRLVELGGWVLNTATPTVTGWLQTAASNAWDALRTAAGWTSRVIGEVTSWVIETGAPTVTGWLQSAAGNAWDALKSAAGWTWDNVAQIGRITAQVEGWTVTALENLWDKVTDFIDIEIGAGGGGRGISDAERASGAPMGAGGFRLPAIRVHVGDWDVTVDTAQLYDDIDAKFRADTSIEGRDFSAYEDLGRSHGEKIGQAFGLGVSDGISVSGGDGDGGTDAFAPIRAGFRAYLEGIGIGIMAEIDTLEIPIITPIQQRLSQMFERIFDFGDMPNTITDFERSTGAPMAAGGTTFGQRIMERLRGVFQTAADFIMAGPTEGAGNLFGPIDTAFTWVSEQFQTAVDTMIDGLDADISLDGLTDWWDGLWDFELSTPDFDITSALPDIGFDVEDIPGWDRAMSAGAELVRFLNDPIGYLRERNGGGDGPTAWGGITDSERRSGIPMASVLDVEGIITTAEQEMQETNQGILDMLERETGEGFNDGQPFMANIPLDFEFSIGGARGIGASVGAAIGGGGGGGLSGIRSEVENLFSGITITPPDFAPLVTAAQTALQTVTVAVTTQSSAWATIVSVQGQAMAAAAQAGGAAMRAAMQGAMQAVTSAVTSGMAASTAAVVSGMAASTAAVVSGMAASAGAVRSGVAAMTGAMTAGVAAMVGAITAGMAAATAAVQANASQWPGIIAAVGGAMAAAGFAAGQAAGQGVASGMLSTLGMVQSAANQIVATVNSALRAAAQIASPSRLTAYIGEMLGMGMYGGMVATLPLLSAAAGQMALAATPPMPATGAMAGGGRTSIHAPVSVNATITGGDGWSAADRNQFAAEFASALRDGVEIEYTSRGMTP